MKVGWGVRIGVGGVVDGLLIEYFSVVPYIFLERKLVLVQEMELEGVIDVGFETSRGSGEALGAVLVSLADPGFQSVLDVLFLICERVHLFLLTHAVNSSKLSSLPISDKSR